MRVECEICGAYTEDSNQIEWAKKYRTCPECRHIGSLFIAEEDESMREFNIDVTINMSFNIHAKNYEEAKDIVGRKIRQGVGAYDSLYFNRAEEVVDYDTEDCEFENEYEVLCFNTDGILVHEYSIEADHTLGAATAAEEFFRDDYPAETLETIRVIVGDDFEEYNV